MLVRFWSTILLAAVLATPGSLRAAPRITPFGLEGKVVTSLMEYGSLYAGTLEDGVFRRDIVDPGSSWIPLGLQGKKIRAVYPHQSGPLGLAITAGIESEPGLPDSALVYCSELSQPWVVTDDGMTRGEVWAVWSLDGFPSPAVCGETYAATIGSMGQVWRRGFSSTEWEMVFDVGFGVGNVVRVDPASGNVWAGGENALLAPWIARSTDLGDSWDVAYPDLAGDNACNAIAIHPRDPDIAFAGMEGHVIKTTNGGVTWNATGLVDTDAYIYGLALDSAGANHVLAGGLILNLDRWALWESFDAGGTWTEIPPPTIEPPATVSGISSLVADPTKPGTVYIGTLGHGAWKYENVATGAELLHRRGGLVLEQNSPNPFNPRTSLRFEVPESLDGNRGRMTVHDARGALLRVLIDRGLEAGRHSVVWDGRDERGRPSPSGIYFCRLQVGSFRVMRKIDLVR